MNASWVLNPDFQYFGWTSPVQKNRKGTTRITINKLGGCLCSEETGSLCEQNQGHPLSVCPIYNLCDGNPGNETDNPDNFVAGIGLILEPGPREPGSTLTPTPTPTATISHSPTPTPTCGLPQVLANVRLETVEMFEVLKAWQQEATEPGMDANCDGVLDDWDIWMICNFWNP
jgi:hypothetical protein